MTPLQEIHTFALKWIPKFEDLEIDCIELVDHYMADDCEALGFVMDCGHAFGRKYGVASGDYESLRQVIDAVDDIMLLGSAIYSQWRYFNHWAYDTEEILEPDNRAWFVIALKRMAFLTDRSRFDQPQETVSSLPLMLTINPAWDGKNADLLTQLGHSMEKGTIFPQNYQAAKQFYELAGKAGDSQAIFYYGRMLHNGIGVKKDISQAVKFYEIAAKDGNVSAMINLGNIYEFGQLGEPDYPQCFKWYRAAADKGSQKGLFNYANCYHYGYGVRKNYKKAFSIFKKLADDGFDSAFFYVGLYYQEGRGGLVKDYYLARHYYRLGALVNDMYCYNQLGVLYAEGLGVEQDFHAALDYYHTAARLGDALAYTNIGWFYEHGDLGEPDPVEAVKYYEKAAAMGENHAMEALVRISESSKHSEPSENSIIHA